jgi:small subunit ribosomal protein S20
VANTKTAKKQILITARNHARNLALRTRLKTMVKRAKAAIAAAANQEEAQTAVNEAARTLYKSATKGIIKKQNASRRVSRLMKGYATAFGLRTAPAATATAAAEE